MNHQMASANTITQVQMTKEARDGEKTARGSDDLQHATDDDQ